MSMLYFFRFCFVWQQSGEGQSSGLSQKRSPTEETGAAGRNSNSSVSNSQQFKLELFTAMCQKVLICLIYATKTFLLLRCCNDVFLFANMLTYIPTVIRRFYRDAQLVISLSHFGQPGLHSYVFTFL